jgi:putative selenium metabolism hydrolase
MPEAGIDDRAVERFLLELVGIESHSAHEQEAAKAFGDELARLGFDVDVDRLGNVIGTLELGDGPTILLDGHLDTVPAGEPSLWTRDPSGEISDGRVFGRGSVDMKGPLAACVHGVASLRKRGRGTVVVSGSLAEELVEGYALLGIAERVAPDCVVICEPSSGRIARGQRGRAEVLVEVEGRSAHSAYPEAGLNAAEVMTDVISELRELRAPHDDTLGDGILVLTDVKSLPYPALSVVPNRCLATYDRRILVGETEASVIEPIRAVVDRVAASWGCVARVQFAVDRFTTYTGASVEAPNFAPAWCQELDSSLVTAAVEALRASGLPAEVSHYRFTTNGSASAGRLGLPTIGYGPGEEARAHTADESIALSELQAGARGYAAIVSALLKSEIADQGRR